MQCPRCQQTMRERERQTPSGDLVVMDICPGCGGIWLDAGELEKLSQSEVRYYANRRDDDDDDDDDDRRRYERSGSRAPYQQKKKKGFFANLMENFGGEEGD